MNVLTLVQKLGLSNYHKDGHVLCPYCNKPIADGDLKTLVADVHQGFLWHSKCQVAFLSPPLRLEAL